MTIAEPTTQTIQCLAGDDWFAASGQTHEIVNPADTTEEVATVNYATPADVARVVEAAQAAFPAWHDTPIVERCRILMRCKERLEEAMDEAWPNCRPIISGSRTGSTYSP